MDENVSELNKDFWNELCGSQLARSLGVVDDTKESLALFDDWFMNFYPYLPEHIPFDEFRDRKVLEVGLGYGTIAQKIAESGAKYTALDIAEGPVHMVRHRLSQNGLLGEAKVGSILEAPFENESFDWVVAIGCYHHTGNTQLALDETWRILKPGGRAMVMVYNAFSYRRWLWSFSETWSYFRASRDNDYKLFAASSRERGLYDANEGGEAAPHTDFFSASHIKNMTAKWNKVSVYPENVGSELILRRFSRKFGLATVGKKLGLDIYCHLQK